MLKKEREREDWTKWKGWERHSGLVQWDCGGKRKKGREWKVKKVEQRSANSKVEKGKDDLWSEFFFSFVFFFFF